MCRNWGGRTFACRPRTNVPGSLVQSSKRQQTSIGGRHGKSGSSLNARKAALDGISNLQGILDTNLRCVVLCVTVMGRRDDLLIVMPQSTSSHWQTNDRPYSSHLSSQFGSDMQAAMYIVMMNNTNNVSFTGITLLTGMAQKSQIIAERLNVITVIHGPTSFANCSGWLLCKI